MRNFTKEQLDKILNDHKIYLEGGCLTMRADLSGADLSMADLSGSDLRVANLRWADLSEADLSGADLSRADLSGAYLSRANLTKSNLRGANLSGANLSMADLSRADLIGANLSKSNLREADLSGARFYQTGFNLGCGSLKIGECDLDLMYQLIYHAASLPCCDSETKKILAPLANLFRLVESKEVPSI